MPSAAMAATSAMKAATACVEAAAAVEPAEARMSASREAVRHAPVIEAAEGAGMRPGPGTVGHRRRMSKVLAPMLERRAMSTEVSERAALRMPGSVIVDQRAVTP